MILDGLEAVQAAAGTHLGYSDWLEVGPERVAGFAAATGDPDATFLAVSLSNFFLPQIVEVQGVSMGVNYGANQVRLAPQLSLAGRRVRAGAELTEVTPIAGGVQTTMVITVELDGGDEPACVIESLSRWME